MAEIRHCMLRNSEVIIAPNRLHRPTQFKPYTELYDIKDCPFEVGNEDATPTEIFRTTNREGEWLTRVVPNLYNALDIDEKNNSTRDGFFTKKSAFGAHEVIIETPSHEKRVNNYTLEQWEAYINTINHRIDDLSKDSRLKHIQIFKNHGSLAGATLKHPHSQLIATGFVPQEIKSEYKRCKKYFKKEYRTLLMDIVSEELKIAKRVVFENNTFVAFTPYASFYPFEIIIAPKKNISNLNNLNQQQIHNLAQTLQNVYKKLYGVLGDFHFNMIFKNPIENREYFTFYINITPRIYMLAGFELATNLRINPVTPEIAAEKLKEVL